ncbi:hypothetical protein VUR80DRAFT_7323 [Thermomyces stellatus]
MTGKDPSRDVERLPMPTRNPLPLSATQEAQIREIYHNRVRAHCSEEIKAFAACARGRTFTVSFACRDTLRAMNGCMKDHATQAEQDAARQEWFETRLQRQRERERKEIKKAAQEDFIREWWGLGERDEESKKKVAEKLARKERVGGLSPSERRSQENN